MIDNLYLREVTKDDLELLFYWANNPDVRKNAFHSEPISIDDHIIWFQKLLCDDTQYQFILMKEDVAIGQIRLSLDDEKESAEIDYSIDSHYRGKGYGHKILELACIKVSEEYPNIRRLIGKVKTGNTASEGCFSDLGFKKSFIQFEYDIVE